ncbi:cache domain-containing protein (plasmid) [Acinetobacter schindleri]|nr:cache domain-containing protein [Acinetobacter schindleri]
MRDPNGQGWVHLFARRYNQGDGTFAGMIITALPASYFNHLIAELDVGPKGVVLLQDLDMRVIARNPMLKTPNGKVGFVGATGTVTTGSLRRTVWHYLYSTNYR